MKLPQKLAPWAEQLKIFPDETSLALGALAQRLAPFINALKAADEISGGEPSGYDGIIRRGLYDRLLLSETALIDEFPEEFIRRAVMGEHLFLNLARMTPGAKRVSVALFDAGAHQLGTPRVAHLAALVVLARRAEAARAAFFWGVLQDEETKTFAEVTESNIMSLLAARNLQYVTGAQIDGWREKLKTLDSVADVWLVGAPDIKNLREADGFSVLTIEEILEASAAERRRLLISVKAASAAERRTILELPEDAICTRLLRNPFEVYRQPAKVNSDSDFGSFFFDENGGKLFARGRANALLCFNVPNSPNAAFGKPRLYQVGDDQKILLAAGRLGKSVAAVSLAENGHLRLEYPKHGNFKLPSGNYALSNTDIFLPGDNETLLPIYNLHYSNSPVYQAALVDAKGSLLIFHRGNDATPGCVGHITKAATGILMAARIENRFVYVGRESSSDTMRIVSFGAKIEKRDLPLAQVTQVFFGRGTAYASKVFGLLAVGDAENNFVVVTESGDSHLEATPGSRVVGVFHDPNFAAEVGLIELGEDRRAVSLNVGRRHGKQIFGSPEEIVRIIFSHRSPVCAYQTISGKIVIFSLTHRVPLGTIGGSEKKQDSVQS